MPVCDARCGLPRLPSHQPTSTGSCPRLEAVQVWKLSNGICPSLEAGSLEARRLPRWSMPEVWIKRFPLATPPSRGLVEHVVSRHLPSSRGSRRLVTRWLSRDDDTRQGADPRQRAAMREMTACMVTSVKNGAKWATCDCGSTVPCWAMAPRGCAFSCRPRSSLSGNMSTANHDCQEGSG